MAEKWYRMTIEVPTRLLTTVHQVLEGECRIVEAAKPVNGTNHKSKFYVGGKKFKGIRGEDLVFKTIDELGGGASTFEITEAFKRNSFSESSVTSRINDMYKKGLIEKAGQQWRRRNTVVPIKAG